MLSEKRFLEDAGLQNEKSMPSIVLRVFKVQTLYGSLI